MRSQKFEYLEVRYGHTQKGYKPLIYSPEHQLQTLTRTHTSVHIYGSSFGFSSNFAAFLH